MMWGLLLLHMMAAGCQVALRAGAQLTGALNKTRRILWMHCFIPMMYAAHCISASLGALLSLQVC
jgi:hypothetical protein